MAKLKKLMIGMIASASMASALLATPAAATTSSFPWLCIGDNYDGGGWKLSAPGWISPGKVICTGNYELAMQGDGNLVLYNANGSAIWASGTYGHSAAALNMQADGNLVVYSTYNNSSSTPLWATGTWGNSGSYFFFQPDGNLVVYRYGGGPSTGGALWASGTYGK
ncbi:hypothetical protein ACFV4P_34255 [Kitasatospora sp. NPDC059795]|uniref:hypothetical protein n=1 Tax=Kitasatospora sp. NPDC059795 TaxID=3346949 RepID=UPI00364C302A